VDDRTTVTTEPVRIEVVRWRCPFCAKSSSRRPSIRLHIPTCFSNPAAQACGSCWRWEKEDGQAVCLAGYPMKVIEDDPWTPGEKREVYVRNCSGWVAKPTN
jgi:hypothetical protein